MCLLLKEHHRFLFFSFILSSLSIAQDSIACSLQFTSPTRGSTVFIASVSVSGTGSGNANLGAIGTVTATVNGTPFFQQTGTFTTLINFFGTGSASVNLKEGPNLITVSGSVQGCSATDSMVIYYEPDINTPNKMAGEPQVCTGNPVNIATGNKYQEEVLYKDELTSFNFSNYYNSDLAKEDMGIGYGWSGQTLKKIILNGSTLLRSDSTGASERFTKTNGSWQADPDSQLTIEENTLGIIIRKPNNETEQYNTHGQLLSTTNQLNYKTTYEYNSLGLLNLIKGPFGKTVTLTYDSSAHLNTMIAPNGGVYAYHYDGLGNLVSVTYPDGTPSDDSDNPVRTYHYENTDFPHHLTGITDENGIRFATWAYDTQGRAISSEHAGGVEKATLDFSVDNQVTVTNALGKDTTYHFTTLHGVKKVTSVEGHATATCVAANKAYTYDANGYLASKTDWQGNVTSYVHDDRGLEVSRTEAVGTSEERTITTTWHADFRLPLTITEPGKVTSFSYDGQGKLLNTTISAQ